MFGELSTIDRTDISQLERFAIKPFVEVIAKIASALQVPQGTLIENVDR